MCCSLLPGRPVRGWKPRYALCQTEPSSILEPSVARTGSTGQRCYRIRWNRNVLPVRPFPILNSSSKYVVNLQILHVNEQTQGAFSLKAKRTRDRTCGVLSLDKQIWRCQGQVHAELGRHVRRPHAHIKSKTGRGHSTSSHHALPNHPLLRTTCACQSAPWHNGKL